MDFFKALAIDSNKSNDGVLVTYPGTKGAKKITFVIARSSNRAAKRRLAALMKKNRTALDAASEADDDETTEALWKDMTIEVMAKDILKGWTGPVSYDGQDLSQYSVENAKKLLDLETFRNWVDTQSSDSKLFRLHTEEDEKN